ncbi:SDR family oxidoreductase [Allopusillimonas soli]|uniref:SDR family oxidoreductase n=1 Tax=Allopusillimonas soli TaxID=659016 RepID=A0A853FDT1_9BURK|nr:SDR family oxidoreductase [Allopusillimonas soli]NYT37878.1 SDR family oxidoreductase [Allopusillimonas soli]TEA73782.1 SDR family oxidoreductase [Allopusillimonas soli]
MTAQDKGVVIVTGGASGIGQALAQGLLDEGWRVLGIDVQPDRIDAARREMLAADTSMLRFAQADVTDETAISEIVQDCEAAFGPIVGVVNSAGIARDIPCLDTEVDIFRQILEVNVIGSFVVARAAARHMRARQAGSIIFIASVSGMRGNQGRVAYGASKGGVVTMTQVMAVELAQHGIRVNAIAPGPIETPLTQVVHTPEVRSTWESRVALRRYGRPDELRGTVGWLMDESRSSYVTGQIIAVDGGFTAMGLPGPWQQQAGTA